MCQVMSMCCSMKKSIYVNLGHTRFVILINITLKMKTAKSNSCLIFIEPGFIICKANILKHHRKLKAFIFSCVVVFKDKFQTPALRRRMFRRNFLKLGQSSLQPAMPSGGIVGPRYRSSGHLFFTNKTTKLS